MLAGVYFPMVLRNNVRDVSLRMGQFWKNKMQESAIFRSWWVFLFFLLCYGIYSHSIEKKRDIEMELKLRIQELEREKQSALCEQEDLLTQINSQSDPAWIEMVLRKGLGVVPDGQVKVYFED